MQSAGYKLCINVDLGFKFKISIILFVHAEKPILEPSQLPFISQTAGFMAAACNLGPTLWAWHALRWIEPSNCQMMNVGCRRGSLLCKRGTCRHGTFIHQTGTAVIPLQYRKRSRRVDAPHRSQDCVVFSFFSLPCFETCLKPLEEISSY